MKRLLYISLFLLALISCMGEEEFSSLPSDRLSFSIDTLKLDTVISGEATKRYTLQLFNNNDKALRIKHVALRKGSESPFIVNVDGTWINGGLSSDEFIVSSKDSLRVFVMMNPPATDNDEPQAIEDRLEFTLESGVMQHVVLTASSQDVNVLRGEIITKNTTLDSKRPYQILDSLVVAEDATLTIKAGVTMLFHQGASLIVRGRLKVVGSQDAPVVMRGDRLDYMFKNQFKNQPYDRIPGQWGGIVFTKTSLGNDMTWCDIHSTTNGIVCDSTGIEKQKLIIDNSIIHNSSRNALSSCYCQIFVGNCQITNAGGDCVSLIGGNNTFVHCTIGQFYSFVGGRGVALRFANSTNNSPIPLEKCMFANCLITGYNDDDIMGEASERYQDCPFNYLFINCLLNTPAIEASDNIVECMFEDKKEYDYSNEEEHNTRHAGNFAPRFNFDYLIFPFTLNPESRAVNKADANLTRQSGYTHDLLGNSRLDDDGPDIGAYEAKKAENK